jgi:DNA repair photolyase
MERQPVRGRGISENPPNRFHPVDVVRDGWRDPQDPLPRTELLRDDTKSILSWNDSPDVGFNASINPYRGCEVGCAYCYSRPFHEYLGFSAGLDFETRILVKTKAPDLLRQALSSRSWEPQVIALSGATDPYQPAERRLRITRACLEVLAEFRNPVAVITKRHLVTRDIDLLADLARHGAAAVMLSVTTLRNDVQRVMEPRGATPERRLDAIRRLSEAGIPVGVMVAPVVPGLTDHEMAAILAAAADAGASRAGFIMLRLPHGVGELFEAWLEQHFPARRGKVLGRVRDVRGGRLYDSRYGPRQRGHGPFAEQIRRMFEITCRRVGLVHGEGSALSAAAFRRPGGAQRSLFNEGDG